MAPPPFERAERCAVLLGYFTFFDCRMPLRDPAKIANGFPDGIGRRRDIDHFFDIEREGGPCEAEARSSNQES